MENSILEKLKEEAINKALQGKFESAIITNLEILKIVPKDTDAMMQLAHAYVQTGNYPDAERNYKKILSLEPNNNLAKKKISFIKGLSSKTKLNPNRKTGRIVYISDLIEEPGKTKIVRLSTVGKPEDISRLSIGEEVSLSIRKRKIELRDIENNFVGYLPDDISKRLIQFIQTDCQYEAFVFSIEKNEVRVFLREVKKSKKLRAISSFINDNSPLLINQDIETKDDKETDEQDVDVETDPSITTEEESHEKDEDADENDENQDKDDYHENLYEE